MTIPTLSRPESPTEAKTCQAPKLGLVHGYAPMVGDHFHKPAGTYISPFDADPVPTPERNAVVTMMSPGHVVVLIDGEEYTMPKGDFIPLAEKTLAHGSTLIRSA